MTVHSRRARRGTRRVHGQMGTFAQAPVADFEATTVTAVQKLY